MRSTDPLRPPTRKGAIRAQMWQDALEAHTAGRIQTTELRASDYFGPDLGQTAHLGDRVVPKALAGKRVSVMGNPDAAHSWSYIGDVCRTLAVLGTDDRSLGRAWHAPTAPPLSARQMIEQICVSAGVEPVRVGSIPKLAIKAIGLVVPIMGELAEMLYQFEHEFVIDAKDCQATFGITETPLDVQMKETIASYR